MQKKRFIHRLEELILVALILLNFFEFFEFLPADLGYIKKIISWTALGYLLYKASLTNIFFNNKHRHVDLLIILAYFMLTFKNLIIFSSSLLEEFVFFHGFQKFIVDNASMLEIWSLIMGSSFILLLAIYSAFFITVKKPSLMHIIHEEGRPNSIFKLLVRIIAIYFVYMSFFIVVFNLVMEWLVIAIDAPLIMLAVLIYLFIIIRHYKKYRLESLIYRIGEVGDNFYKKFISLFHYKKTILLGISGMLVLHLLTDALSFLIPYIFVFKDSLYFSHLGSGHTALLPLFLEQAASEPFIEQISLFFVYLLNTIGILFLLILPSFFWYIAFSGKKYHISDSSIVLIISSISIFLIAPVFKISRLTEKAILGVDIKTGFANNIFSNFYQTVFFIFILVVLIFLLHSQYKKHLIYLILFKSTFFFIYYIFLFFTSLVIYYISIISTLINTSRFILSLHFMIFFAITILFYIAGFIMFIDELIKEKVYKKIS